MTLQPQQIKPPLTASPMIRSLWASAQEIQKGSWQPFLDRVTYKPNFRFIHWYQQERDWHYVRIEMDVPNTYSAEHEIIQIQTSQQVPAFYLIKEDAAKLILRRMIHDLEMHEADEWLLIDGVREWDPHANDFTT